MLTSKQKAEWVAALRSGEFEQGRRGKLHCEGKFCCLGVLAKINGLSTNGALLVTEEHSSIDLSLDESANELPMCDVFDVCGMPPMHPFSSLALANDSGVPFNEIADHIEKYLPVKSVD